MWLDRTRETILKIILNFTQYERGIRVYIDHSDVIQILK